ncbi:MAG TPA: RepB family plasmid replication initiator protein, partial [Aquificales bacterium]|nr:RepB family plasmid replication initiator protein [Aquificales bacterium]
NRLEIIYTPWVAPLLVLLKKWFTLYNFEEVLSLDLKPSIVLYRLFREKLGLKKQKVFISKEDLIGLLGLKKVDVRDLRRKYLEPAVKELNEKTSLRVEMKPIRRGRGGKIIGFHFKVWEIISTKGGLVEKVKELIETLSKDEALEVSPKELAEALLSLERVNPATALWFMLHYPEGEARFYAWEHIKMTEQNTKIRYPDRYLESLIRDKDESLDWLLDQRTKDTIREELKKLLEKGEKKEKPKTDREMEKLLNRLEEIKPLIRLYYDQIAEYFEIDDLKEFLDNLIKREDKERLEEFIAFVETLEKAPPLN